MRFLSSRGRLAAALAMGPLLAACGVLLDVGDAPATPDGTDSGTASETRTPEAASGGDAAVDQAAAVDACATPAACAPELLAKLSGGVVRLVVSGSSLYAAHSAASGSHVVRLASGAPGPALDLDPQSTVPEAFRGDSNIAVDATGAVYWGTPNGLRRHEAAGGADASTDAGVTDLSALGAPVSGVRIGADGRLHFTVNGPPSGANVNTGHLASCALPGCSDVQIAGYVAYPLDVIAIGASRWWLGTDNLIQNLALRGAAYVSPEQLSPSRMVTDGQHIYWSTVDGLRMFTMAGNVLAELLAAPTTAVTRVNGIALDADGTLYVTQQSNVARCMMAAGKCTPSPLATTAGLATDVAVDATHVYWGTNDGSIWRLRKP